MFWTNFTTLCRETGKSPNSVAHDLGFSTGTVTWWKKGRAPQNSTLKKIADYFDVSVDYLLGNTDEKKKPTALGGEPLQTEDPLLKDAIAIMEKLSPEKQEQAFQFLQFLSKDSQHSH